MTLEVPEGWSRVKQGDVATFFNGRAYKKSEWEEAGTPVIRLQNLTGRGEKYYYSKLELPEHQYCDKGDLLYMWSATFGPHIWQNDKAIYHYHIWKVICDETRLDKKFHYYLLDQKTKEWLSGANGMAMLHITKGNMEKVELQIPPLSEQKKIAEVLSSVDEAIAATKAVIDQTKQVKKGLLQTLLTKGIGHTQFKQSELGQIPESWEVLSLDDITPPNRKITYGIVQAGPHINDGVPYIRVSDMNETGLSLKGMMRTSPDIAAKYKRSEVQDGDIVYALRGKIGHVLPVPDFLSGANLTQGTARIAPGERVTSRYLFWVMAAPRTVQLALREVKGSTFKEITLKKLKSLLITVPPIEEQNQIAEKFDGIETALNVSLEKLAQLQVLKSGLMSDLLSGRKRVEV